MAHRDQPCGEISGLVNAYVRAYRLCLFYVFVLKYRINKRAITSIPMQAYMSNSKEPQESPREYRMTVAGQLFKHLGLQMYSGAVPAISELISNAYDAMARNVWIIIPTEERIQESHKIIVKDDGCGMSYEECNSHYLPVGKNRRRSRGESTFEYNGLTPRKVQGRKGIGKLAGFGIADMMDIRTIRDEQISHFFMDYVKLTESSKFADSEGYNPTPGPDDGISTDEKPGTIITLSKLKISRKINQNEFIKSIARRLLVLDENFTVYVNDEPIARKNIPLQFRFPEEPDSWETETLENGYKFEWWAGFCEKTIQNEEQRGLVVYAHGKLAQAPWFFDLSGGVWGQHGMQYLTGEIRADFLDEQLDLIATDRSAVRWDDPDSAQLKQWGQQRVKKLLQIWAEGRKKTKIQSPTISSYLKFSERLPKRERKIFETAVNRVCSIPQLDKDTEGKDVADEIVEFIYNALTNRSFLDAIRHLNAVSSDDMEKLTKILSEWDVLELVNTAHLVRGHVEIIRKFKDMIHKQVPEIPDMHNYVRDHPWLIDPKWNVLVHERSLDTLISKHFREAKSGEHEGKQRVDFFCLGDKFNTAIVVEIKKPGNAVGKKEFDQLEQYVLFLRKHLQQSADQENRRQTVRGLLIADKITRGDEELAKSRQKSGIFDMRTWTNVLLTTENLHAEFLDAIKERAPDDDPRITGLETIPEESET